MSEEQKPVAQVSSVQPVVKPASVQQAVNAAAAKQLSPSMMAQIEARKFSTSEIVNPFFRCFLYGDIDAGKTTVAARFGTPEDTRIIVTRQKEQLLPLKKMGYKAFHADTVALFRVAVMYPETIWPEWANIEGRTLVIDDMTQAKDILNDDNSTTDEGAEVKDIRRISKSSKDDMRELIQLSALGKPMNIIITALEKSWEVGKQIKISPDLPPSMASMINADFEFVFNIVKENAMTRTLITETSFENFVKKDEKGKDTPYQIVRFARNKIPNEWVGKGIVKPREPADLRALWQRIKSGAAK